MTLFVATRASGLSLQLMNLRAAREDVQNVARNQVIALCLLCLWKQGRQALHDTGGLGCKLTSPFGRKGAAE